MSNLTEPISRDTEPADRARIKLALRRKPAEPKTEHAGVRYFLASGDNTGPAPSLGQEFPGEKEALIEALRTGRNFFSLSEWKPVPDFSGKNPQIIKEAVFPG
jgi:hypothetical protein